MTRQEAVFFLNKCHFALGAIRITAGSWLRGQFSDFVAIEILWRRADNQLFYSSNLLNNRIYEFQKKIAKIGSKFFFTPSGKVTNLLSTLISLKTAERSEAKSAKQNLRIKVS